MSKKQRFGQFGFGLGLALLGFLMLGHPVQAAAQTQNADFEIQPVLPSEQVDNSLHYYDVSYEPGTTHVIKMKVQNFTDHEMTLKSDFQNGMTQDGGGMKFQQSIKKLDVSLKIPFTTVATIKKADQTIKLGPKEATTISATIKMPEQKFDGMIAGGWHFIEYVKSTGNAKQSVSSNYAYMVSVNLRGSKYEVYPKLAYDSTKPMLFNKHPAMGIKLRNTEPMVLKNVTFQAVLYRDGQYASRRVFNKTQSSIAPNSSVTLPISWQYETLKPGKYHVDVKVNGQNLWDLKKMNWSFKKTFTVTGKEADDINSEAIKRPINFWFYIAAASGVMMLITLGGAIVVLRMVV